MVNFIFLKFGMGKLLSTLHIVLNVKMTVFQMKRVEKITLFLLFIYSFIELKY